jgi:hypothetical protein
MALKTGRFVSVCCAALVLGLTLTHGLEIPLFAFGNNPLNQQILAWTARTLPANWREIRDAFHAASSALAALALIILLVAILGER